MLTVTNLSAISQEASFKTLSDVAVPTATAILFAQSNPWLVLVSKSLKHERPVLPGGKIDLTDSSGSEEQTALLACRREVREEVGADPDRFSLLEVSSDPKRDVRVVAKSCLEKAAIREPLPESEFVRAHYGCPDFIFLAAIREDQVSTSDELKEPRLVDVREIRPGDLSAGHDHYLIRYRKMLESGQF